jgi:hypothetical protein
VGDINDALDSINNEVIWWELQHKN